jgi:transcriptional regulator NrdR family protein
MSRRHPGIHCPLCDAPSRVIDTRRREDHVERVRQCRGEDHLFLTEERPYRSVPGCGDWSTRSRVMNTRNLLDRTIRERVCPGTDVFKTIERVADSDRQPTFDAASGGTASGARSSRG